MLLVNGVTGEIGRSVLSKAISRGIECAGIGRDENKLSELREQFVGTKFYSIKDVADEESAIDAISVIENFQPVSMYLHAAATLRRTDSPIDTPLVNFRETIRINLEGTFIWNKLIIESMMKNNISGSLLNMSSQAARTGGFGSNLAYATSKGGVETLTKSFARFASQKGIRVNAIAPGFVNNPMMLSGISEVQKDFFMKKTLFNRFAENHEIASVCLFLLGVESSYITGEILEVSAGQKIG